MPGYRSNLFKRNNGGRFSRANARKPFKKARPATVIGTTLANPRPAKTIVSAVNTAEQKQITGTLATIALKDTGQCFHLDQVTQGTGVSQRLGQRHRVTGVTIYGAWEINVDASADQPGYMLVWDRQPNEVLANPGDILALGTDSSRAFPNIDNLGRFEILYRQTFSGSNAQAGPTGNRQNNDNSSWKIESFHDFTAKRLIATQVIGGDGLIGDRTTGALILVGIGAHSASIASNMNFNFRLYFEDV